MTAGVDMPDGRRLADTPGQQLPRVLVRAGRDAMRRAHTRRMTIGQWGG